MPSNDMTYRPAPRATEERRLAAMTFHERKAERIRKNEERRRSKETP